MVMSNGPVDGELLQDKQEKGKKRTLIEEFLDIRPIKGSLPKSEVLSRAEQQQLMKEATLSQESRPATSLSLENPLASYQDPHQSPNPSQSDPSAQPQKSSIESLNRISDKLSETLRRFTISENNSAARIIPELNQTAGNFLEELNKLDTSSFSKDLQGNINALRHSLEGFQEFTQETEDKQSISKDGLNTLQDGGRKLRNLLSKVSI